MSTLADKIKTLRRQAGLTQKELADTLNLTRSTIANWETGRSVPHVDHLYRISQVFETSANYLVNPRNASATNVFVQDDDSLLFLGICPGDRLRYLPDSSPEPGSLFILRSDKTPFAAKIIRTDSELWFQDGIHSFHCLDKDIGLLGRVIKLEREY